MLLCLAVFYKKQMLKLPEFLIYGIYILLRNSTLLCRQLGEADLACQRRLLGGSISTPGIRTKNGRAFLAFHRKWLEAGALSNPAVGCFSLVHVVPRHLKQFGLLLWIRTFQINRRQIVHIFIVQLLLSIVTVAFLPLFLLAVSDNVIITPKLILFIPLINSELRF